MPPNRPVIENSKRNERSRFEGVEVWEPGPVDPVLNKGVIHLWRVGLNPDALRVRKLTDLLSQEERKRADRFRFDPHRDHFIVARGCLRILLGRYLRVEPSTVQFKYSSRGKPRVLPTGDDEPPRFNLSHSGDLALIGLAADRDIGVDLEHSGREVRDMKIAERFFSAAEVNALKRVDDDRKAEAFLNCWTRKEAFIKATGEGLSCPLDKFEVSLAPGEPAVVRYVDDELEVTRKWWMAAPNPGEDYVAAVAAPGEKVSLVLWDMDE